MEQLGTILRKPMADPIFYSTINTPISKLFIISSGEAITGLYMITRERRPMKEPNWRRADKLFEEAQNQLLAYFAGELMEFDLLLDPKGTLFQQSVWKELNKIPYGTTTTYGELARKIGNPNASRAVGAANGSNPISIIIPCHRVIGSNHHLTGYGGGIERKRALLDLEASVIDRHRES